MTRRVDPSHSSAGKTPQLSVFVAMGDAARRRCLTGLLRSLWLHVTVSLDGQQMLPRLAMVCSEGACRNHRRSDFDLLLIDPDLVADVPHWVAAVRAAGYGGPIFAVSADAARRPEFVGGGFDDFLIFPPMTSQDLSARIRRTLESQSIRLAPAG
jgi:CheY-like chemotaxis protein